jgi:hypothetical protein
MSIVGFDPSLLLGFYQAQLGSMTTSSLPTNSQSSLANLSSTSLSNKNSATANDVTPWSITPPAQSARDSQVLAINNFVDLTKVPVLTGQSADAKTEQDNQKLFALYTAVNNLAYLASMSKRDGMTAGQMAGFDSRFQTGLKQVQDFIASAKFNNFTLQAATPSSSVTSGAGVPSPTFTYNTPTLVSNANLTSPLPGLSSTDQFTISVSKGGVKTDVNIDLSQVQGGLTLDHVIQYVNQQLSANGFGTRFQKVLTQGTIDQPTKASWGLQISPSGTESVSLSAPQSTPALYVAGTTGLTTPTGTTAADSQGRLVKLTNLDDPVSDFSRNTAPTKGTSGQSTGTSTAQGTVVDSSGNVYMLGNTTGSFGSQLNQGSQDVYLSKFDSAGNLQWTKLVGSAGTANGASLALNPNGGVTVVGSTNADLIPTAAADGNVDTFVTRFDAQGSQQWTTQIQTLNQNSGASVSVDATGNVYIGGQTTGAIGKGQTKIGGSDAYVAKLDNKGKVVYEQQFGTTSNDNVSATALDASGNLLVASVQNGHAVLSKYTGGDATQAPAWTTDLGSLQAGGAISGLTIANGKIYLSGTTQNPALGGAPVQNANSGGIDAFVLTATDNGASVTANGISYVGTSGNDKGGAVTVGPDGTVYLTGTTSGTFAGQVRNTTKTDNMFVAALQTDGSVKWVRQYGGLDGQSTGTGIAVDAQGSSVLDALGLPRGSVSGTQTPDLLSATTLRAGDSFKVAITSTMDRSFTITIDKGETLQSLVTKLNGQLWGAGTASVTYGSSGAALKIQVNQGVTATFQSGPSGLDALGRLGITSGTVLTNGQSTTSKTGTTSTSSAAQSFGLGLNPKMDITTTTDAGATRAQLLNVLSAIQKAYQKSNTPAASTTGPTGSGSMSAAQSSAMQSQLANYNLALNILGSSTSVTG